MRIITRVVYHGVTSSFFGIGILLVSDLMGFRYFRSVLLYCKLWREHLFKISRLFLNNSVGIPFFLQKEGEMYKKGAGAPLLRKKGAPANFLRGSRQNFDTKY